MQWFKYLDAFGTTWTVILDDRSKLHHINTEDGITICNDNIIEVVREGDDNKILLVFFHELIHSCISTVGDTKILTSMFGIKDEEAQDFEEKIVSLLAPRLFALLIKNNMLKLPKVPKQ